MLVEGDPECLRKQWLQAPVPKLNPYLAMNSQTLSARLINDRERRARIMPMVARAKEGRIITVFSARGGGKTTVATNLAVELSKKPNRNVVMVDLDLQFGDAAIMLDTVPLRTIADIAREEEVDPEIVEACLFTHSTGIRVLPSPLRPEQAEIVTGKHVEAILSILAESFDFVVVDLPQGLGDISLTAMDAADVVCLITSLELHAIKSKYLSGLMDALGYDDDKVACSKQAVWSAGHQ